MNDQELKNIANVLRDENKIGDLLKLLIGDAKDCHVFTEGVYGNVYIRPMFFPDVGSIIPGHGHNYHHTAMWWRGAVNCRYWGLDNQGLCATKIKEDQHKALSWMEIDKGIGHEYTALEAGTLGLCLFSHRDYKGNVVEKFMGNMHAYA